MGQPDTADLMKKFKELCADLNMDKAAADEALLSFQRIGMNYTLEVSIAPHPHLSRLTTVPQGDKLHWLACALYVSCRRGKTPTVGGRPIDGNCVSLTRLLRSCGLRSVSFSSVHVLL